ncbi:hypothetical protein GUA46_15140 [Muricauda sp. HICW]|uniref:Uncharacterized protein n=1 Tax=Flagellimonas chongwuensis TaxID=2697365 RepID=A0A850NEW8_9FLAO|nr:hypothetical protein [Allomuricauda chongwuensis]NVN19681.1 hypothetical protein [Allomuricauda chongwuensis]
MKDFDKNTRVIFFSELFEDAYASPAELAEVLDLGIEMLFYVEGDAFSRDDIRNVVTALRKITLELRK